MPQPAQPRNVGILIFPDVEILDFCGPFEVFASATLPAQSEGGPETRLIEVFTVAERSELVACPGGLRVQPNHTLDDHPPLDLVVVPGGYGTRREQENPVILDWIARQRRTGASTTSVCTGAFLLGAAGLLDGLHATTHWTTIDGLRTNLPTTRFSPTPASSTKGRSSPLPASPPASTWRSTSSAGYTATRSRGALRTTWSTTG
jgi:transcriptional regulator GlxA family with amidase domain